MTSKSRDEKMSAQQDQIAEMRVQQSNGLDKLDRVEANRQLNLSEPTKLNIKDIRADEAERFVHVFTRVKHDDPISKRYNFEDKIIQIHASEFDRKVQQQYFQLFDESHVIHDPRKDAPSNYSLKERVAAPAARV